MVEVVDDVIEVEIVEEMIEVEIGEGVIPPEWGTITGDLANQRDLQEALDEKADADDLGALALKDQADWDDDIANKPSVFPPAAHDHDDRYYTEAESDAALALKQDVLTFDNVPAAGSSNPVTSDGIKSALDGKAAVIVCDASGNPVTVSDGAPTPVVDLTVGIEPVQDLHGYDHPYPAGGGKNIFDGVVFESGKSLDNDTGEIVTNNNYNVYKITNIENSDYTLSIYDTNTSASKSIKVAIYDSSDIKLDNVIVTPYTNASTTRISATIPANANASYMLFVARSSTYDIQVEKGSSATSYEPYSNICPITGRTGLTLTANGTNHAISWQSQAGMVYGGNLDVTTGVLTVDMFTEIFDGSEDENWAKYSDSTTHYYINVQNLPDRSNCTWGEGITNIYPWATNASGTATKVARFQNQQSQSYVFYCIGTEIETLAEFKAFLNDTPLQVCYKIAAPLTYQLTPIEVTTLLGDNIISADTGPVTLRYRADTKLYIDGKFAELQALILEN